jgi:hypothetical protein
MPPRRHTTNAKMEEEMRRLRMRLDTMETTKRRAPDTGDVSGSESEEEDEAGENVAEDATQDS